MNLFTSLCSRLQIYIHLYWHLFVRLSALAVWSHYIYNIFGIGPCSSSDVMTSPPLNRCECREMCAESPSETTTRRSGTWWPSKWRRGSWASSSSQGWSVLGFPSTAMPLYLWKKTRTCQLETMCSVPWVVQRHCSTVQSRVKLFEGCTAVSCQDVNLG